ncbi:MAG: acetyl/propionyl/methylcrotonyl-CoA carboxylase subunit alpha [Pseudooceanicola sp.]
MFEKILIANRGEIACRIMRTAKEMGIATVAVYSDADAGAMHVAMADEAVRIGGPAPAESYLRGEAVIAAARETGAQAIHPGYGFLSENPGFADAVESAGLVFVGPSASAMRAMALKDAAKTLMSEAGVPVVPGYQGSDQDDTVLSEAADKIGFPVMIKAVAGGGGKGMRVVETQAGFADALKSARNEASAAFGNADVLIEKYIQNPRHIEVQVFGDGVRALHLFERDCSLQRRHQKVIEEAPAPGMTEAMRAAMGDAAVKAAEAIGYKGAGTVEFIVDGSGPLDPDKFWFMEMNTRLQVEHPVTEAITGVDLVEWQIRVAAGEPMPKRQEELSIEGHAFEARLYAEDVDKGFLPATGRIAHLEFPAAVRADTGVRPGDTITPHYDPMIAKIIVHGATRAAALARLARACRETQVAGTVTNLAFLGALAEHDGFGRGEVDTGLIGREIDRLTAAVPPRGAEAAWAAMVALGLDAAPGPFDGFTLWTPLGRQVALVHRGEAMTVRAEVSGPGRMVLHVPDAEVAAAWRDGAWTLAGQAAPAHFHADGRVTVFGAGAAQVFDILDPLEAEDQAAGGNVIEAPMPGMVKALTVTVGEQVAAGDRLAVLEAMKMEHALTAPRDGVVAEVLTEEGAQVEAGAALIRLEEDE